MREALAPEQAVIGFAGGPFTVAGYLIEGKPTREFKLTKACMYTQPEVWHALMEKLARRSALPGRLQVGAGRRRRSSSSTRGPALLGPRTTASSSRRTRAGLAAVDVPTIHFGTGTGTCSRTWRSRRRRDRRRLASPDRSRLAARRLGAAACREPRAGAALGPWERVEAAALRILEAVGARPGHIFNLGHGVLPETDPGDLRRLVELVHENTLVAA